MQAHEKLPSGKQVSRQFDAAGRIKSETHSYGLLDIGMTIDFEAGTKVAETYYFKKRMVSRERYDKARAEYADMPPSDRDIRDFGAELAEGMRAERRQRATAARSHVPDEQEAAKADSFCRVILEKGKTADAEAWIKSMKHTLGERSHLRSQALVDKLIRLGAKHLYACEIDCYENEQQNTGHLVVELPDDRKIRKSLFREADRLASLQGFQGEFDNGQRYLYLKLD